MEFASVLFEMTEIHRHSPTHSVRGVETRHLDRNCHGFLTKIVCGDSRFQNPNGPSIEDDLNET
jgi:hypothetical protein